eukprot:TRINITY_DN5439_c0_g2_i1.p2 TRINITY_DN5439_c0_g2~~TRINITY_DN5439_c0_g2_i1.p2  ORF type:complete len:131 (-),score=43.97 TRINITY_DN5439_c0_g2_i1:70-462(-)
MGPPTVEPEKTRDEADAANASSQPRPIQIVTSTMAREFEKSATEIAASAFDYYKQPKDVATYIKKEFDKRYPSDGKATSGVYHCIVGRNFAASVSYETRFFLHFRVGQENVIIFKSKDSPFDTDQVELNK